MGNKKRDRRNQNDVPKYQTDFETHDPCDDYSEENKKGYSITISQDSTRMKKKKQ